LTCNGAVVFWITVPFLHPHAFYDRHLLMKMKHFCTARISWTLITESYE
jgi:hypothetical protein